MSRPAITLAGSLVGVSVVGTGLLVASQYGLNQDFTKPAPPSEVGWTLAVGGIASLIGGGMALGAETAGSKAFGRGMLAVAAGVTGALLIGAPVVRRMISDD